MNFDSLTIGEVTTLEDISGLPLAQIDEDKPLGRVLKALVYIMSNRTDHPLTLEEIDALPMEEANRIIEPLTEGDATRP